MDKSNAQKNTDKWFKELELQTGEDLVYSTKSMIKVQVIKTDDSYRGE